MTIFIFAWTNPLMLIICRTQRWAGSGRWSMCFSKLSALSSVLRNTSVKMAAFSRSPACPNSTKCLKDAEVQHIVVLCNSFSYQKWLFLLRFILVSWQTQNDRDHNTHYVCHIISDDQQTLNWGFIDICTADV